MVRGTTFRSCACVILLGMSRFALWPPTSLAQATVDEASHESAEVADQPVATPAPVSESLKVFGLRTEFYPAAYDASCRSDRLARELCRQAVLIAARDGLGLATRDESLQEPIPESLITTKRAVNIAARAQRDGKVKLTIWTGNTTLAEAREEIGDGKTLIQEGSYIVAPYQSYLTLLAELEPMTRNQLVDRLRNLGYDRKAVGLNPENKPNASVEASLAEMNFISSYGVVRQAHVAIAKDGESPEWLGMLVRGYANLRLTSFHHWTSVSDVFAARSLLYAERLVNSRPNDAMAYANRAYARALVGLHAAALADLRKVDSLRHDSGKQAAIPSWLAVIGPFCRFEREALAKVVNDSPQLSQLSQRLAFELVRFFDDPRWAMDAATRAMEACPDEYGIYAYLASNNSLLAVKRTGAYQAPSALSRYVPERIAALVDLPLAVRESVKTNWMAIFGGRDDRALGGLFSQKATDIAAGLIKAGESEDGLGEPSWTVLGKLIQEEQFTQIANFLGVATDATETSLVELVDDVWPLVKDHRYAWYIKSFSVNARSDTKAWAEIVGNPRFVDERGTMYRMFRKAWNVHPNQSRSGRGRVASWHALIGSSMTLPELVLSVSQGDHTWWEPMGATLQRQYANEINAISPYSPQALRFRMSLVSEPTPQHLADWESKAGQDPSAYSSLGAWHVNRRSFDDAIRCYEQSIKLSPSYDSYVALAQCYREKEQPELWKPTLERFLKVPALGLEHAWIHQLIANDFISREEWPAAESHALSAAQTWSASGLLLAADVYEGLGRWTESEKWIREAATSYPTGTALHWYFWCRRTGRGSLAEARGLAQKTMTSDWIKGDSEGDLVMLTYHALEGELPKAIQNAKQHIDRSAKSTAELRVYNQASLALLAYEQKEIDILRTAIAEIRRIISEEGKTLDDLASSAGEIAETVCNLLDGKQVDDAAIGAATEKTSRLPEEIRPEFLYILARALEFRDQVDAAEKLYRSIIDKHPFYRFSRILAGHRLAERHGTSRP